MKILKKTVDVSDCPLSIATLNAIAQTLSPLSAFVAGGAALHIYTRGVYRLNDIDVFCFKHPILSADDQYNEIHEKLIGFNYELKHTSTTGLVKTYNHNFETHKDVQVICTQYDNIEAMFSNFDFDISQMLFDGRSLFCTEDAVQNVATKTVTVNNLSRPLNSAMRLCKLYNLGFFVEGAMAKLLVEVNKSPDISQAALVEYCELLEARN